MRATTKNALFLLVAVAVAGALGLYAYFGVARPEEEKSRQQEREARLFPTPPGLDGGALALEFTRLEVVARGDRTALVAHDGQWRLTSPLSAPADRDTVQALLGQLRAGSLGAKVDPAPEPEDLTRYGLTQPAFSVTAAARTSPDGGEIEVTLAGGIENPYDGSTYLRRSGDPAVYAAPRSVRTALEQDTFALRDKAVLAFDPAPLTRLELRKQGQQRWVVERTAAGWTLTQPLQAPADTEQVTAMLAALAEERALSFPKDEPHTRQALGLSAPELELTFTPKAGEPWTLRFSRAEGKTYGLREGGGASVLAEVAATALLPIDKTADELRDKRVLDFDKEAVARIELHEPGQPPVLAERTSADAGADTWQVIAPRTGRAQSWKLSSLLWNLATLKASAIAAEAPKSWAKYGLGDGARLVKLSGAGGQPLGELRIGHPVSSRPGHLYVRGDKPIVYEVDVARLQELPRTVDDLLEVAPPDAGHFP